MTDRDPPHARDSPPSPPGGERAVWFGDEPGPGNDDVAASAAPGWPAYFAPLALITAIVLGSVGGALVALIIGAVLGLNVSGNNLAPGLEITATAVQDAVFVVVAVFFARRVRGRGGPAQFGLRTTNLWAAIAMILILYVSLIVVTALWTAAFDDHSKETLLNNLGTNDNNVLLVASAFLTCVIAPFCEEFLFRGYLFTALRNWRGPWPAAVLTGLAFGGVHVLSAPLVDLVPLAFFGFGLCILYWRTRSLLPGIAAHSINNSIAFASLEGWAGRDYVILAVAAVGVLGLLATSLKSMGLIVPASRPEAVVG